MPVLVHDGVRVHYDRTGDGEPVILVMGTGSSGRVWHLHQVPALVGAGFTAITPTNRGVAPSDLCDRGFGLGDLVGDLVRLVEELGLGPCRFVGTSMGSYVVQELALARPDLVRQAVLIATRGRLDAFRAAVGHADRELYDSGVTLPARYDAVVRALQNLSPRSLDDEQAIADWLDVFEMNGIGGPGYRAQLDLEPPDRLGAYARITAPCHVIAFADDLVTPPYLGREVARAIPGATFEVLPGCGHYGYLEDPAAVNKSIVEFFRLPMRKEP
jgi:pimeloyl-ACP methyl ester carboxylesterase